MIGAYAAYELALFAVTPFLGGTEAFTAAIVVRLGSISAVWLIGSRPSLVADPRPLLAVLSDDAELARRRFIDVVADGRGLPPYSEHKAILGDRAFVERHAPSQMPTSPVVRTAWKEARPPIGELVDHLPADEALRQARLVHRYTLGEIASALGCSVSTVSRRLTRLGGTT